LNDEAGYTMDERCFLITFKCHFENDEVRENHEHTHKKNFDRLSLQLPPFWQFIRINTPDVENVNFFDFLNVNHHPWFKSKIYRCIAKNGETVCNFISATQASHKLKGSFVEGTLAVLITHVDGTSTFSQELKLSL
jgi:hypothetical protein